MHLKSLYTEKIIDAKIWLIMFLHSYDDQALASPMTNSKAPIMGKMLVGLPPIIDEVCPCWLSE